MSHSSAFCGFEMIAAFGIVRVVYLRLGEIREQKSETAGYREQAGMRGQMIRDTNLYLVKRTASADELVPEANEEWILDNHPHKPGRLHSST